MSFLQKLIGYTSGNGAEVDSNNNLKVNLPTVKSQAGYGVMLSEMHDGATGAAALRRSPRTSPDGRLSAGLDQTFWQDTFNHAIQDTSAYRMTATTSTFNVTGGYKIFNANNSIASGASAIVQTYRSFPLNAAASLEVVFRARLAVMPQNNNVIEMGLGFASGTTTPTDGIYFKFNSSGALVGVMNFNSSETTTDPIDAGIVNGENNYYRIVIDQDRAEFYINGTLYGVLSVPNTAASVSFSRSLPLLMRQYNSAAVTTAQRLEVSDVAVIGRDLANNRLWATASAGMEFGSYNNARGSTAGQSANYTNSAAPASATLSNTAAGYTTLGGQFQFAAVAGAETDYALFGFQVPAASVSGANKNLIIRGIRIETANTGAAVATTPTLLQWALGVGATAVSLATADSATAGTRAPRRIPLGFQSFAIGAAIGALATPVDVNLDAPVYVGSGTFVHIILKMPLGTATASQVIRGMVTINGYYE